MSTYGKIDTLYQRDEHHKLHIDSLRIKRPLLETIDTWVATEKVDGTNIRIGFARDIFDSRIVMGPFVGGRSDKADTPKDLVAHCEAAVDYEMARQIMDLHDLQTLTLFGEGYGAGIQKGGGDYRPDKGFILFDVLVKGMDGRQRWLDEDAISDTATDFDLPRVPILGLDSIENWTKLVYNGIESQVAINPGKQAEGVVLRPVEPLYDQRGNRLLVKIKTRDFA